MSDNTSPAAASPAPMLASLFESTASASDIVALAAMLPRFDHAHARPKAFGHPQKSLLRVATEREISPSIALLDALAATHADGSKAAWALANDPPLSTWAATRLAERRYSPASFPKELAMRIIELSAPSQLLLGRGGDSLMESLLQRSGATELGIEPFLAAAAKLGHTMASARRPDGSLAILEAKCSAAFDAFLKAGGDPRQDIDGTPLWDHLRLIASRRHEDKELFHALDAWGKANESDREDARLKREYFESLGSYAGDKRLKDRKDWPTIVDEHGRTAMMAVCMGSGSAIKAFWGVKKAEPGAATADKDGRTLWHALIARGKDAPVGAAAYLAEHAPLAPDHAGRGLLSSVWAWSKAHGDSRFGTNEHEWLFESNELGRACAFAPSAKAWLGCSDPAEGAAFGAWLANERYLGSKNAKGFVSLHNTRGIVVLAKLAMRLDAVSFGSIHPAIAGAMAFNLAIDPTHRDASEKEAQLAKIAAILSQGAHIQLTPERDQLLDQASAPAAAMIRSAFAAAAEAKELSASVADPKDAAKAPGLRI